MARLSLTTGQAHFAESKMAGNARSGRKPASARAAFLHFAEEYVEQGHSRFEAWLLAEHQAALDGDGTARRFLIEQYAGRARQTHEVGVSETYNVTLRWADGRLASHSKAAAIDGEYVERLPPPRD